MIDYTSKYVSERIGLNLKTLNNISIGEFDKKYSDIYSLTSHEYRYSGLSIGMKILSFPLVAVSSVIKTFSGEVVAIKKLCNMPLMLLHKMDQGIARKILHGLQGISEEELNEITSNTLSQWQDDEQLILQEEQSWFSSVKSRAMNYVCDNIGFINRIKNFWVHNGISYSEGQLNERQLIKQITKEIFKLGYMTGKKGELLTKEDIYEHLLGQKACNVDIKDSVPVTAESEKSMINADEAKQLLKLDKEAVFINEEKNIDQAAYDNEFLQQLGLLYLKSKLNWMVCNTNSNKANICNELQELLPKVDGIDASYGYNNIDLMGDNSVSYNPQFELKDYGYNMVSCAA